MLKPLLLDLAGAHWVLGSLEWDPTLENWGEAAAEAAERS